MTENHGVDRRPEVVDVRDPDVLAAALDEADRGGCPAKGIDGIAMARGVLAGLPVVVTEQRAVRVQAEREVLLERRDVRGSPAFRERRRRWRRASPRSSSARAARGGRRGRSRCGYSARRIEEGVAVGDLGERLDDAAHARGHASRHGAEGELPCGERSATAIAKPRVLGGPRCRKGRDLLGPGRGDVAFDGVAGASPLSDRPPSATTPTR